ncbi:probable sulfate transporter 4.2 isoform X2 [Beta vulgaris subsp. vulgaris]|uniref:probable sulfate transporter 4.2 isoform X2 n=1 Tax=Beta vulgaris subsp. vulgaris TaxID=3555 RepID=UPI0025481BB5|nr:probable sulfate transporter 4.2 isoform X2 [Beta vulgaris subsp. vulgaris]
MVGFSLAFVVHESANPHIAVLGRLSGTTIYRKVQQYPVAYPYHGVVLVRVDAPIYFANTSYIKGCANMNPILINLYGVGQKSNKFILENSF